MIGDKVTQLLRDVERGVVSVEDARNALEGVDLSEDDYIKAVDHGVFNDPKPGTIVRASISPSGDSWLVILVGLWGITWNPILGWNVILRAIQQMGPAAVIFPPRNDITHANNTRHRLPKVRNAGCSRS